MSGIVDHKDAVIAQLKLDTVLADCGFEGVVTPEGDDYPERYWTIFTDSGVRSSDRFGGLPNQATYHYTVHSVGTTPEQAQRIADRVITQLAGVQLAVPGWAPFLLVHASSYPTQMDDTVRPPLHFSVDRFTLRTQPSV